MGDSKFNFFITDIILLIVFLGLIRIIFGFDGFGFLLELLFVVVLLFISFIALIPAYSGSRGGWGFLSGVFFLILLDLLAIYLMANVTGKTFLITALLSAIGFVVSIMNIKKEEEIEKAVEEPIKEEAPVYTNFEPGKYIASKTGSSYHIPKCDWAKKIKRQNQVWLNSEEEAKKKGFKKHSCLK